MYLAQINKPIGQSLIDALRSLLFIAEKFTVLAQAVKNLPANAGNLSSILGLGRSREGNGNPLHYSCLEDPHGQKRLAGYSPWGS